MDTSTIKDFFAWAAAVNLASHRGLSSHEEYMKEAETIYFEILAAKAKKTTAAN